MYLIVIPKVSPALCDKAVARGPQVKLGPSFLIPNGQIGTFGGVTAFKSMVRTRTDLFDVAVAGPTAGGATALAIFALGLALTLGGSDAQVRADASLEVVFKVYTIYTHRRHGGISPTALNSVGWDGLYTDVDLRGSRPM